MKGGIAGVCEGRFAEHDMETITLLGWASQLPSQIDIPVTRGLTTRLDL
jgi:hypothetical protein